MKGPDVRRRMIGKLPPPDRVRKHGTEYVYACSQPTCEGKQGSTLELNVKTGLFHCFRCGWSGRIDDIGKLALTAPVPRPDVDNPEVKAVPKSVYRALSHRGCNPEYVIDRYKIGWDGWRLCWQVSADMYWRRGIYAYQDPKVLFDPGEKGVLGEHLLDKKQYVVITEGDYKAASIPLPYVGIAIGGSTITNNQLDILAYYRPRMVIVALDGGVNPGSVVRKLRAKDIPTQSLSLPKGLGPDDIPIRERIALLGRAFAKYVKQKKGR